MKHCRICNKKKAAIHFYYLICKACHKIRKALHYQKNKKRILGKSKLYYMENRDHKIKLARKWVKNNPIKRKLNLEKYKSANKHKIKMRSILNKALLKGTVVKSSCVICGNKKVEAHHDDYTKPLDIKWLCRSHHGAWHRVFLTN